MALETYNLDDPTKPWIWADPDSDLDYSRQWGVGENGDPPWLSPGDSILTLTPIFEAPLLQGSFPNFISGGNTTVIWCKVGSTAKTNKMYKLTFRIVTTQGRKDDRSVWLKIRER